MKKLKVSGIKHVVGSPFRSILSKMNVSYHEKLAYQNAQELALGLVDLALIPSIDYASHGGYQILPFGISCSGFSNRLFLYANEDITSLSTIYLYEDSGASSWLLKILLAEYFSIEPKLIYLKRKINVSELEDSEGLVMLHEFPKEDHGINTKTKVDLVKVWYDWTGFPFVFHIWCSNESLSLETENTIKSQFSSLSEIPKDLIKYQGTGLSKEFYEFYFFNNNYSFCLKENDLAGLKLFLSLCAKHKLSSDYNSDFTKKKQFKKNVDSILQDCVNGDRLNISDALIIAKKAKLSELGVVADLIRQRLYSSSSKKLVSEFKNAGYNEDAEHIIISSLKNKTFDFNFYQKMIQDIKISSDKTVEGFSTQMINAIAETSQLGVHEIVKLLSDSGLDYILGDYPDIFSGKKKEYLHNFDDWMRLMRWAHRYARGSSCSIPVLGNDMWDSWFVFLSQVRSLQDFSYGFRYVVIKDFTNKSGSTNFLRTVALSRLFLDNISNHAVLCDEESLNLAELAKSFGTNQIMRLI